MRGYAHRCGRWPQRFEKWLAQPARPGPKPQRERRSRRPRVRGVAVPRDGAAVVARPEHLPPAAMLAGPPAPLLLGCSRWRPATDATCHSASRSRRPESRTKPVRLSEYPKPRDGAEAPPLGTPTAWDGTAAAADRGPLPWGRTGCKEAGERTTPTTQRPSAKRPAGFTFGFPWGCQLGVYLFDRRRSAVEVRHV